jgi:anion-transporting  ArsA/GET3 family ATPase
MTQVIICCGVGGTGKTTTAAALGVGHALAGHRVCVLTIDPARRLADALCLPELDNTPRIVPLDGLTVPDGGALHAMMLDRKSTWDDVIRRFSRSPETADRLLANRYYRAVSTRLTGSHEYMAIEKLFQLVQQGSWDIIIVDTPPTEHVLDFFQSPERVRQVFDRTVLASLTRPGRGLLGSAARRASRVMERLAGDNVMNDITEFFGLISELASGFRARSEAVGKILVSSDTQYYLIARASAPERNDILGFLETLRERDMHFAGFLLNRVATSPGTEPTWSLGDSPCPPDATAEQWAAWLDSFAAKQDEIFERARRHEDAAHRLSAAAGAPVWRVPDLIDGVGSLEKLARLGEFLPPNPPAPPFIAPNQPDGASAPDSTVYSA